jgi:ABC-type sugar transport system substrate-binding protein
MTKYNLFMFIFTLVLISGLLVGCASSTPQAPQAPTQVTQMSTDIPISEPSADKPLNFGLVVHFRSPFTDQIAQGAQDAANACGGLNLEVVGPPGFDAATQIGMFDALVQKGLDGIAVIPYPPETWQEPINKAVDAGVDVLSLNVYAPESKAPAWFGQDEVSSGVVLAQELLKLLQGKSGEVVIGTCAPGANVLLDREAGFREGMKNNPEFKILGPFDVGVEAAKNYAAWENLLSAHPDSLAMIGLCSPDMPNLAKLRERTGAEFVAVGYDLEPDAMEGISKGYADVTLGQHPYLQGYLPVFAFCQKFLDGTPYPQGWVDVGTEVVDISNVKQLMERENSAQKTQEYYNAIIAEKYSDMSAVAKPFPGSQ